LYYHLGGAFSWLVLVSEKSQAVLEEGKEDVACWVRRVRELKGCGPCSMESRVGKSIGDYEKSLLDTTGGRL